MFNTLARHLPKRRCPAAQPPERPPARPSLRTVGSRPPRPSGSKNSGFPPSCEYTTQRLDSLVCTRPLLPGSSRASCSSLMDGKACRQQVRTLQFSAWILRGAVSCCRCKHSQREHRPSTLGSSRVVTKSPGRAD